VFTPPHSSDGVVGRSLYASALITAGVDCARASLMDHFPVGNDDDDEKSRIAPPPQGCGIIGVKLSE